MNATGRSTRTLMDKLLSIVHALEFLSLLFGALAVWGVTRDWPAPTMFIVLAIYLLVTARYQKYSWGWMLSLVGQVAMVSLGFIEPVMFVVAVVFVAMWIFCFVKARQADGR